ncbi:uncharacterized protein LOC125877681 [Solanum stenotomum]|uniref:uncharacterized protein LOC125877681 n=1 Tax=Solanum stenotomum TaxID=172797 RepID=UPI0020D05E58|nr:uncharacterized protein LOC125877681 [Solanum stenotomum]
MSDSSLVAFSDAGWISDPDDSHSQHGFALFYGGNLISWSSRKQKVVARSSTEVEYRALAFATTELIWVQQLISELHSPLTAPPTVLCDNLSAQFLSQNPVIHQRSKHIRLDYHFIREMVEDQSLVVRYVLSQNQIADIFTKVVGTSRNGAKVSERRLRFATDFEEMRLSFIRPISCCSVSSPATSLKLQKPLFLRPPTFKTTISDLKKWHLWAKSLTSSVGSTFLELDNGPDSELLLRELNWLVEDAIQTPKSFLQQPQKNYNDNSSVSIRASLEELYMLWKQRVEERRPFQYVVGCEHWRDLVLSVQEGVLIPRPETELIVDLVDDAIKENEELREGLWADLGTGSGALAIGIARILGSSGRVVATDLSPVATAVASYNVQRYELEGKVHVKQGSWFEPLRDDEGQFVGLVSNPPYIPSKDIGGLQAEVGRHEPRLALDGGASGMNDLIHLCDGAVSMLKPGGFFAFETNGDEQSKFLVHYIETKKQGNFSKVKMVPDSAGIQRFITGFRGR